MRYFSFAETKGLKRKLLAVVLVIIAIGLLLAGCGQSSTPTPSPSDGDNNSEPTEQAEPAKTYELSLAHMWPAGHETETLVVEGWIEAVDKATDGQIKITSYPAATLLTGPETYEGVVQGVADIGIGVYAYSRGRFPIVEAFLLPGISYNNSKAATYAINEGITTLNPAEVADVHHLFSYATGPGWFVMDRPITKMEDLKGVEIGVTSGPRVDAVDAMGGIGVNVPMPQFYENLQSGIIKGGVFPLEVLQGFRLSEVTGDYITDVPFLYSQKFFSVMNSDTWNSIPPDLQKKFTDATQKFYEENVPGWFDDINQKGWEYHKEQKPGVEITSLSAEEEARWLEKIEPVIQDYAKTLDEKGLDGDKIMESVREIVDKYNNQFPK